jgi:hypothetical protein
VVGDITHQVSPFAGSVPDDFVVIGVVYGSRNHWWCREPRDWFKSRTGSAELGGYWISGEELSINIRSSLDFLDGFGLDQEFELNDLQEKEDTSTYGFFRAKVGEGAFAFFDFFVDRIHVSPHVCKP